MTTKTTKKSWKEILIKIEDRLAEIFIGKLPAMPDKVKEAIVKYGPYIALVMMVFTIPFILAIIGIGIVATPSAFLGGNGNGFGIIVSALLGLIMVILEIMAIQGLFKRQKKAWKLMFYISLIQAFSYIARFQLGSLIIGTGISWYVLFQIRSYYKN